MPVRLPAVVSSCGVIGAVPSDLQVRRYRGLKARPALRVRICPASAARPALQAHLVQTGRMEIQLHQGRPEIQAVRGRKVRRAIPATPARKVHWDCPALRVWMKTRRRAILDCPAPLGLQVPKGQTATGEQPAPMGLPARRAIPEIRRPSSPYATAATSG